MQGAFCHAVQPVIKTKCVTCNLSVSYIDTNYRSTLATLLLAQDGNYTLGLLSIKNLKIRPDFVHKILVTNGYLSKTVSET